MKNFLWAMAIGLWVTTFNIKAAETNFGPEWTFTSATMREKCPSTILCDYGSEVRDEFINGFVAKCDARCAENPEFCCHQEGHKLIFDDGAWYEIGLDEGVIEVIASKITYEQANSRIGRTRGRMIFQGAAELQDPLIPHEQTGGGHIHLGLKAFSKKMKSLDYLIFLNNYPHLLVAGWQKCRVYSAPIALLKRSKGTQFRDSLKECRKKSVIDCYKFIRRNTYTQAANKPNGSNDARRKNFYPGGKAQAVNVDRITEEHIKEGTATVENRYFGPQESYEHWLAQIKVLDKIVTHINKNPQQDFNNTRVKEWDELVRKSLLKKINPAKELAKNCEAVIQKALEEAKALAKTVGITDREIQESLHVNARTARPQKAAVPCLIRYSTDPSIRPLLNSMKSLDPYLSLPSIERKRSRDSE